MTLVCCYIHPATFMPHFEAFSICPPISNLFTLYLLTKYVHFDCTAVSPLLILPFMALQFSHSCRKNFLAVVIALFFRGETLPSSWNKDALLPQKRLQGTAVCAHIHHLQHANTRLHHEEKLMVCYATIWYDKFIQYWALPTGRAQVFTCCQF